ncbi:MAG: DUF4160 domain-containing protein [Dethiobacter sp.]|nr:DUF4160 domain-containing protein [Dethiobacter sp.]
MGEIAIFEDIRIKMYPFDTQKHKEPHFHVILSDGRKASVAISDGRVLEGELTRRHRDLIMAWMLIHKEDIWDRWNKAVSGEHIEKIEPKQI